MPIFYFCGDHWYIVEIELDLPDNKGNPKLINSEATFVWPIVLNRSIEDIERQYQEYMGRFRWCQLRRRP